MNASLSFTLEPSGVSLPDQEPFLVDLVQGIIDTNEFEVIPEHSPVKDSKANGQAENAVCKAEEMCRATRFSLEQKLEADIPILHPINLWLVKHA